MKKISFTALLIAFALPFAVHAQTVTTTSSLPFCYDFETNLGLNSAISPSDATALQQVLVAQGFWNQNIPITSYNREVEIAVEAFQEKYASQILAPNGLTQPTGYMGVSTRSVLNQLYGCATGSVPVIVGLITTPGPGAPLSSQESIVCPAGWTCTPPVTVNTADFCPFGWTCVPTSSLMNVTVPPLIPATSTQPYLNVNSNSFFSLASQPTISVANITPGGATTTTLKYTATFNVNIDAVTGNLILGLPGSTSPAFRADPTSLAIYKNGTQDLLSNYNVTVSYSQPTGTTLTPDDGSFIVSQGQTVTVPVTYAFLVNATSASSYAVQLQGIYSSLGLINSMMNQPTWRTASE